jgi:hypothetical protein
MKAKYSKDQMVLFICVLGSLDTGFAWLLNGKGWVFIDLIFWPVVLLVVLVAKNSDSEKS